MERTQYEIDQEAQFARERAQLTETQQRQRAARNEQLRQERITAMADAKAARDKARAEAAEKELRAHLRAQYMKQPAATEADFDKAYPKLREHHLNRMAIEAPELERRALAATGRYGAM